MLSGTPSSRSNVSYNAASRFVARLVGELGRALEHARRRHTFLDGVVELAAFRREFVPARERYTRRAGKLAALRSYWYSTSSSAVFDASMAEYNMIAFI